MKIKNITNPISFQKKLVATCTVQKDNHPLHCNIFELSKEDDEFYFEGIERKKEWATNRYLHEARCALEEDYVGTERFYTIENKQRQCLGYAIIDRCRTPKSIDLELLETCLPHSSRNEDRRIKYVGETLVSFLTKLAKNENLSELCVPLTAKTAKDFYRNCGFQEKGTTGFFTLKNKDFNQLIEKNEFNTNGTIDFVV